MTQKLKPVIWTVSIVVPLVVAAMLSPSFPKIELGFNTYILPRINAGINSTVSVLLLIGLFLIKNRRIPQHKAVMLSAFVLSALFLITYVLYHISTPSTAYCDAGPVPRSLYFFVLISHIGLSVFIVPLASFSIFHGLTERFDRHRRIAKITWPLWFYVSVTGVLVYFLISPCYPEGV